MKKLLYSALIVSAFFASDMVCMDQQEFQQGDEDYTPPLSPKGERGRPVNESPSGKRKHHSKSRSQEREQVNGYFIVPGEVLQIDDNDNPGLDLSEFKTSPVTKHESLTTIPMSVFIKSIVQQIFAQDESESQNYIHPQMKQHMDGIYSDVRNLVNHGTKSNTFNIWPEDVQTAVQEHKKDNGNNNNNTENSKKGRSKQEMNKKKSNFISFVSGGAVFCGMMCLYQYLWRK